VWTALTVEIEAMPVEMLSKWNSSDRIQLAEKVKSEVVQWLDRSHGVEHVRVEHFSVYFQP